MPKAFSAVELQRTVYTGGMMGIQPVVPVDPFRLEQAAKEKMSGAAFAYIAGGAGMESTMDANRRAFERWRIQPRMLKDVSERDTSIELFGQRLPTPFLTCPIGVLEMAHPEADIAVAKATANLGVPMIFSSQASFPMEACAAAMGTSPRWFQLYWSKSDALVQSFVQRAEQCGCSAIVLTLDTTLLGWRTRDLDLAYLPFLRGLGIAQYLSDPVFMRLLEEPEPAGGAVLKPRLSWETIRNLRSVVRKYPGKGSFLAKLRSGKP
ncbi:MAG: alpha-hydroxy-acid oxidizing protein, partial [Saprospiraceae bacterium]